MQDSFCLPVDVETLNGALQLLEELRGYLYSISPSVPTASGYARKVESFLNNPNISAQERNYDRLNKMRAVRHGVVSTGSGMPLLNLEVSNDIGMVSLPDLPVCFEGQEKERLELIINRLLSNKRETFVLVNGPLSGD